MNADRVAALVTGFDRSPAYRGLAEALRVLIGDGRIPAGVRLPSERELTVALDVSRTTVTRAYADLREHGYLVSRRGSGSVAARPASRGHTDHLLAPAPTDPSETRVDLTCAAPAPGPGLLAAYQQAVEELPSYLVGTGYFPTGLPALREAVADAYADRGLPTTPDQVIVVPGALAGVAVAARALLRRGDRVLTESPTYPNAIATFTGHGARLAGLDVDPDDGSSGVPGVAEALRQVSPAAAYLVPDFHNPTGRLLPDDRRAELGSALGRAGTPAIVDESMVQLFLDGQEMPAPMAVHARETVSVGSLSKPFWGGLRVGWVRAEGSQVDALLRARLSLDLGVPLLEQLVATRLLREGTELLDRRRRQLREARDAARSAVRARLPDWRVTRPGGGLCLWCELPAARSTALARAAERHDVLLAPGPAFAPEGGLDRYVRIPYTQPAGVLTDAVGRVGDAWHEVREDRTTYRRPKVGRTMVA